METPVAPVTPVTPAEAPAPFAPVPHQIATATDATPEPAAAGDLPNPAELFAPVERQMQQLQSEINDLHQEVTVLRRRDETLKFYMNRVDEEMRLAARLQQDFLPKTLPQLGRVHFHTVFRPAGYVSGDLYDVMRLDETHIGFYMADAVGHGMPAALLTMFIKNALVTKQITTDGYRLLPPAQSMARLNDVLVGQHLSHATFATAIYGLINTETLELTFARGGHPAPLLLRANGSIEELKAEGSLLGIFEDEKFDECKVLLAPGDRLFLFTDGVEVAFSETDSSNPALWQEELERLKHLSTDALLADYVKRLEERSGSLSPKDDLTIIAMDIKE
jgi:serine phosphatase RsbU (regulator of sigma subunit)